MPPRASLTIILMELRNIIALWVPGFMDPLVIGKGQPGSHIDSSIPPLETSYFGYDPSSILGYIIGRYDRVTPGAIVLHDFDAVLFETTSIMIILHE